MNHTDLPEEFVQRMTEQLSEEASDFLATFSDTPPTSIFVHPDKGVGMGEEVIPWNTKGRYLTERPSYVMDPHYHAGAYYPQEASSMLVGHIVSMMNLPSDAFCLDLCASPGGKSINILAALHEDSFLISNEVVRSRVGALKENLRRWGRPNSAITSAHPSKWSNAKDSFDLILVDAPCSGEGMFRKGSNALNEWAIENVEFCAVRQSSILRDITPCLAPGGVLIYSTCTYSVQENEEMMELAISLGLEPATLYLPEEWGFSRVGALANAFQAYPHKVRGEGFFLSVFRRPGERESQEVQAEEVGAEPPIPMKVPVGFYIHNEKGKHSLRSSRFEERLNRLPREIGKIDHGLYIGQMKGKDFIPGHEIAMTGLLKDCELIPLSNEESIRYLRKETFLLDESLENGWYLASHEESLLGWIKIAAGRMKNHYPKEWMIRKRW